MSTINIIKQTISLDITTAIRRMAGVHNISEPDQLAQELLVHLGIVDRDERNRWRELDAIYISLEHGYLAHTTRAALAQRELLEVEGSGALVPQATEDAFYLLHRIAERALVAGSESAALAVGTRVVELLDPAAAAAGGSGLALEGDEGGAVYTYVTDKRRFFRCYQQRSLALLEGEKTAADADAAR